MSIHAATSKYGASLLSYLKAGAVTSQHFHNEVPTNVWSAQVQYIVCTVVYGKCVFSISSSLVLLSVYYM